jgi:hypothetical protein
MKGMTFKKAFFLGVIFLLSTFMSVQLSWGWGDDDKRDCDDHDKHCDPPKIQRVFLDYQADSIVFEIWGKNFDRGAPLVVTLGSIYDLTVDEALTDDNVISATLSPIKDFEFGDYTLVVSTCHDSGCKDKYWKDDRSKCKDENSKDDERKCRCKDRYSLTIAGPPGPPSPITLTRVPALVSLSGCSECVRLFDLSAVCQSGVVTGGGFSCPGCIPIDLGISVNEPLENLSGWHVSGIYGGGNPVDVTIYAICAQSQ